MNYCVVFFFLSPQKEGQSGSCRYLKALLLHVSFPKAILASEQNKTKVEGLESVLVHL